MYVWDKEKYTQLNKKGQKFASYITNSNLKAVIKKQIEIVQQFGYLQCAYLLSC